MAEVLTDTEEAFGSEALLGFMVSFVTAALGTAAMEGWAAFAKANLQDEEVSADVTGLIHAAAMIIAYLER
ncbi:MAG: hypothetical protein O3C69_00955 [Chloroflexi bacterium]|nr:hypothetical protein [Chloroflexota bacterium]